jgi:hypothetical protein
LQLAHLIKWNNRRLRATCDAAGAPCPAIHVTRLHARARRADRRKDPAVRCQPIERPVNGGWAITFAETILSWIVTTLVVKFAHRPAQAALLHDERNARALQQFETTDAWLAEADAGRHHASIAMANNESGMVWFILRALRLPQHRQGKRQQQQNGKG